MRRTATTGLLPTALAVASLGLICGAPALAQDPAAPPEPQPQQPTPPTPQPTPPSPQATPDQPAPDPAQPDGATEGQTERGAPTEEEKGRYERYCNMKDAEPSHSDKKFCEEYREKYGAHASGGPTKEERERYERYCKMKDAEPSHSDKKFCEEYRKKYLQGKGAGAGQDGQTEPADEKSDEPDSGPLAFTGLDIWQLVLLGLVLVGGGLGARRLLTS